ncbi:putative MATE family efflux protein [Breznakia sp. PF5-3]|uniref:MATE family efflux transporter n=1 Tax=unclassified Breznakia TaxID=2623764 RepID=UPI0024059AD1|nr:MULTISPECIES: MATE family efflux transporter [unclassified Breznakia]MDF9825906.1 putative MATE family efflux protein [Breznakia sp. PM6-1]MDF9836702.1 putative MATE family efflux protein [Breznakia sp. PF5-3]MDF9837711.1 putative MATE family efflux protein [Breznakia sp. PFB2-8]MDF9859672.1 putative MATE family efflux protein [Breznakia sp. PH5-24]
MNKVEMKTKCLRKEFAHYAIPAVVGMIVSSLYNIVDGIFVGRGVGEDALGAINIVYPFIMLEIAIVMLIAVGGANHFSVNRGRGSNDKANSIFIQSITILIIIGVILNVVVLIFPEQVCELLGANQQILTYAKEYIWWISLFGIIYMPGLGFSIFIRNDNAPKRELMGTLVGTIINILLDYYFIMVLNMGIAGAAIATGIGQTASVMIFMTHFLKKERVLHIEKINWDLGTLKKIFASGTPTFLMEFSQSAVAFSFNLILMAYVGAEGVSYYSIVMYICSMFNMVLIGLTQGAQPIMSFHYGKGEEDSVKQICDIAIKTSLLLTTLMYLIIYFFGSTLASIFVSDNISLATQAGTMMKSYFLAFFPIGITLMNILYFQIMEQSFVAILLSFLRCIGFVQLFLLILPPILGTSGIYFSFFCGELCHCILSEGIFVFKERKQKQIA